MGALANLPADGWVHSGDLVEQTAHGVVWCGRQDDMILKNGVNVYLAEIENALLGIEGVAEVCVRGQADKVMGQIILAYIAQKEGGELQEMLRSQLSPVKIPDKIYFVTYFDYTYTGKSIKPRR